MIRSNSIFALATCSAALAASAPAPAQDLPEACGWYDLPLIMENQVNTTWTYVPNKQGMGLWNEAMPIFAEAAGDGFWGDNSENEFGGFPSTASLLNQYGFVWGASALALCVTTTVSCECCEIVQADILFNPDQSWTTSVQTAINSDAVYYQSAMMHELGHSWGAERKGVEDYTFDFNTVMHAYYGDITQSKLTVHAVDAQLARAHYDDQVSIPGQLDVGVFPYYSVGNLESATIPAGSYLPGESITVEGLTVEGIGNLAAEDVRLRLYLAESQYIDPFDTLLGEWSFGTVGGYTASTLDFTATVPSMAPGSYFLGAIVTVDGYGADDNYDNDITFLPDPVTIGACTDAFEPNDVLFGSPPIGNPFQADLELCLNDTDWFRVDLDAGEAYTFAILFDHDEGDLDLEAWDLFLGPVDTSNSITDNEQVTVQAGVATSYWFKVFGYDGATNSYSTLGLSTLACPTDVFEPNETFDAAVEIEPGAYPDLGLCENDEDWYRLYLGAGDTITVDIDFEQQLGDLNLYLVDPNGITVVQEQTFTDGESFTYGPIDDIQGKYRIRVLRGGLQPNHDYDLFVAVDQSCPTPALAVNPNYASIEGADICDFDLCAGPDYAGDFYLLLASVAGTSPPTLVDGVPVPIVPDAGTTHSIVFANQFPYAKTFGTLDENGWAEAFYWVNTLVASPSDVGQVRWFAAMIFDAETGAVTAATNATGITLIP